MKHLGDITKIHGDQIPPVDVITGGSPCQDLSVAGLRKGLAGERSGLFMEQIRIVKEMRNSGRTNEYFRPARYFGRKPVTVEWANGEMEEFESLLSASYATGKNYSKLSEILNGKRKQYKEFCIAVTKKHFGEE